MEDTQFVSCTDLSILQGRKKKKKHTVLGEHLLVADIFKLLGYSLF